MAQRLRLRRGKPPPQQPSPEWLAQREALRAAEEFFSSGRGSDDDGSVGAESEGEEDEEDAAAFFAGLFERDAALRAHYERRCEDGRFACMACAGTKVRRGKVRRFRGCVALVQHARAATRYWRPGAHRALATAVCRVLGWDIVMDRRGTLGQALAAEATSDAQEAKESDNTGENNGSCDENEEEEDVETGVDDSSTDGDEEADEPENSKESAEKEDTAEIIGAPNCGESFSN